METRANYALIGVFTLAVIAAAFSFLLWFSGAEKPGGRKTYKIIFSGSVSGLSIGGVVLFNGVRVGAVTKIDLLPQDPSRVDALIDVDAKVPVRADTKARLEYTGFTGVASVALTGGALDAPPLPTSPQQPGVIVAESSEFQGSHRNGAAGRGPSLRFFHQDQPSDRRQFGRHHGFGEECRKILRCACRQFRRPQGFHGHHQAFERKARRPRGRRR